MPPRRLGGERSSEYARIGGAAKGRTLNTKARALADRVKGAAVADGSLVQALGAALKRSRSAAASNIKAGTAAAERELIRKIVADRAPATCESESSSRTKKRTRLEGAEVLGKVRRGATVELELRGAYNSSNHTYDFDGERGAPFSICALGERIRSREFKLEK